jgi:hypothetical protein
MSLIGITPRAASPNVIKAMQAARQIGMTEFGTFWAARWSRRLPECDLAMGGAFHRNRPHQEGHIAIGHALMELIEDGPDRARGHQALPEPGRLPGRRPGDPASRTARAQPQTASGSGWAPFPGLSADEAARHGFTEILLLAGISVSRSRSAIAAAIGGRAHQGAVRTRTARHRRRLAFRLADLADQFLLANGDSFFDINLRSLPRSCGGGVAMALRNVAGDRYGRVKFQDGQVLSFHAPEEGMEGPINGGVYALSRKVVEGSGRKSLAGRRHFSAAWPQRPHPGRQFDGYFIDIGVPWISSAPSRICRGEPAARGFLRSRRRAEPRHWLSAPAWDVEWLEGAKTRCGSATMPAISSLW